MRLTRALPALLLAGIGYQMWAWLPASGPFGNSIASSTAQQDVDGLMPAVIRTIQSEADASYAVRAADAGKLAVGNRSQGLEARFDRTGVEVRVGDRRSAIGDRHARPAADGLRRAASVEKSRESSHPLRLRVTQFGFDGAERELLPADPRAEGTLVVFERDTAGGDGLKEWYVNGPLGLQQGFTIDKPPAAGRSGVLKIRVDVGGDWRATTAPDGQSTTFSASGPESSELRFGSLYAWDANDKPLRASMLGDGNDLVYEVDTERAAWPITIDPVLTGPKLLAVDGAAGDQFGWSVDIDGNTAIVGAYHDAVGAVTFRGSAYVFVRSATSGWTHQAKLEPPAPDNGVSFLRFGFTVAVSGNTAVVGCEFGCPTTSQPAGGIYVYTRLGTSWNFAQKLIQSDLDPEVDFGKSLAIDGNTLVAGSPSCGECTSPGAAYVFVRDASGTWVQQQKLAPSVPFQFEDDFGASVAVEGNRTIVGAPRNGTTALTRPGAAYVFTRTGTVWTLFQKLTVPDGNTCIDGLCDEFGASVDLDDTGLGHVLVGAPGKNIVGATVVNDVGRAYFFFNAGPAYQAGQALNDPAPAAFDRFGTSVGLGHWRRAVIGTDENDIYLFGRSDGGTWASADTFSFTPPTPFFHSVASGTGGGALAGNFYETVSGMTLRGAVYSFPSNNERNAAAFVTLPTTVGAPYVDLLDTQDASATASDPPTPTDCDVNGGNDRSVWYQFTGTGHRFMVDTAQSNYDTVVSIYSQVPGGPLVPVVCDDDSGDGLTSLLSLTTVANTQYFAKITDWVNTGAGGRLRFAVTLATETLTTSTVGSGTITGPGINCGAGGADCSEAYPSLTNVTLSPTPSPGWVFAGWSGACTGTVCNLVMNGPKAVTATFTQNPPTITTLTPNRGSTKGLTPVTITGTNLSGATVLIGNVHALNIVATSTSISLITPPSATAGQTTLLVVTPSGQVSRPFTYVAPEETNVARSRRSALDHSGRYMAFESDAALVPEDTNGLPDVYVLDRLTNTTRRVSVSSFGGQAIGGASGAPTISSSGRFVAFESAATNLVPNDTNRIVDAFLHDRDADDDGVFDEPGRISTIRVSVVDHTQTGLPGGGFAPSINGNGRWIAFESLRLAPVGRDIYVHDRLTGATALASGDPAQGGSSTAPALSANGRFVAFQSTSTNLVPGDANGLADIFVRDRDLDTDGVMDEAAATKIVRVSVSSAMLEALGGPSGGPSITQEGRWVAFVSVATNLVPNDTNGVADFFLHDRDSDADTIFDEAGQVSTVRLSVPPAGTQFGAVTAGVISANGKAVLFTVTNLVQAPPSGPGLASVVSANNGTPGSNTGGTVFIPSPTNPDPGNNPVATEPGEPGSTVDEPALSGDGNTSASTETPPGPNQPDEIEVEGPEPEESPENGVPHIHELEPSQGQANQIVDVEGSGFTPSSPVIWNGAVIASTFRSHDELRVIAPNLTGQVQVRVRNGEQESDPEFFTYSAAPISAPTITSVSPTSGSTAGGAVTISGAGFTGTHVFFGGSAGTITSVNPTTIETQAPPGVAGATVAVVVVNTDGGTAVLDGAFTYALPPPAPPTIANVAPPDGPLDGGTSFTVIGTGFGPGTTVRVGGKPATDIVVWSDTFVSATAPAGTQAGPVDVAVSTAAGEAVKPSSYNYLDLSPFKGTVDSDADGMWDTFEEAFGLLPNVAGDAGDDPDGDGRTNLQEFNDRTHPRGTNVRFLAEGASNVFFSSRIAIANPNDAAATVLARFLPEGGSPIQQFVYMPAKSRRTLTPNPGGPFSTVLESDGELVLDRTMMWQPGAGAHSGHAESSQPAPSPIWYLAEGSTTGFFDLFYLFQNPSLTETAQVRVTFLLANGLPVIKEPYEVPPNGRLSLYVNQIPELAEADLSAIIESTNGVPIIVERAMYASPPGHPTFAAGHGSAGVTAPNPKWFLAEGATGDFFKTYVLIANPSPTDAQVQITYLLPSGGPIVKTHPVPANRRHTIDVSGEDPALAATSMSIVAEALNAVPIIVERAVWWPGGGPWYEAHNSPGTTTTGTKWAVADGELILDGSDTFLLVANTSATAAQVKVTILFEDGTAPTEKIIAVGANSRHTLSVSGDFPVARGRRFGAIVESLGPAPAQIVVERAMYANAQGLLWNIGTNVLATKLQ
jgi:uncharacterized repeat protein (TIGR02543 family)